MKKNKKGCEYCDDCLPIGEGDHICLRKEEPVLVIENYTPNDNYGWCKK